MLKPTNPKAPAAASADFQADRVRPGVRLMRSCAALFPVAASAVLVAGCQSAPPAAKSTPPAAGDEPIAEATFDKALAFPAERTATLWVKGLACPYCVNNVDRQLTGLAGVERVHVDLPTGKVDVALASEKPATREQLEKAIAESGFTLDRIEMPR